MLEYYLELSIVYKLNFIDSDYEMDNKYFKR